MDSRYLFSVCIVFMRCDFGVAWPHTLPGARYLELQSREPSFTFKQRLDHFEPSNRATWKQKYLMNGRWFDVSRPGPVILNIGGEGPANEYYDNIGTMANYAQRFGAMIFQLEHRFYGTSIPEGDYSLNLRYLSSEQALADIAEFIQGMNKLFNFTDTKWVVYGGSYAGSLAAWARLKYPQFVHAAVSVSGPLLAQANFKEYNQVVQKALAAYDMSCADNVHTAALQLEASLRDPRMVNYLSMWFRTCPSYQQYDPCNQKDEASFAVGVASHVGSIVQSDTEELKNVKDVCEVMNNEANGSTLERYAQVSNMFFTNNREIPQCMIGNYEGMIRSRMGDPWLYQVCTEFGWFPTSSSQDDLFGSSIDLEFWIDQCRDVFGPEFNAQRLFQGIKKTNALYHGLDIEVSRVVFIQGSLDPWSGLGINESKPQAPAIVIEGTSHCKFLQTPTPQDPEVLNNARNDVMNLIQEWLLQ